MARRLITQFKFKGNTIEVYRYRIGDVEVIINNVVVKSALSSVEALQYIGSVVERF